MGNGEQSAGNKEQRIVLATINAKWIHPSLALRLLKANLGTLAARTEILEFALRQPLKEKLEPILAAKPRILALSISIWNHKATLELLEALKQVWREKQDAEKPVIVFGGSEISWLPPDAEIFRHADYVIRGEGEESFRQLCQGVFNESAGSNVSSESSESGENEIADFFINKGDTTVDVNKIASAYHFYTDEDLCRKLIYVEASRGCPFACEFCQGGLTAVREFPLEPFLAEMETLIKRGGRTFKFLDRTFNLDMKRAKKIMEFFLEKAQSPEAVDSQNRQPFCVHFEMVPSRFPPELREIIRRFPPGTLRLELGIQTLNPQVRTLICVAGDVEKELEALAFLRIETNAIVHADLIAGLPGEDFASFGAGFDRLWQTISGTSSIAPEISSDSPEIANQNPGIFIQSSGTFFKSPFEIQLGILKCLPGTPIIRHNEAFRMRYSAEPPYEVIETKALSINELERIKNFARFWELIVNRKAFQDLIPRLLSPGEKVFDKFLNLSDQLLRKFGRNWGIAQNELRLYLEELLSHQTIS